jgi:hypothetical protein
MAGENINANGTLLTEEMVRKGFFRFPHSVEAHIASPLYAKVAGMQLPFAYPFTVVENNHVPYSEVWYLDEYKKLVGRIVNVAQSAPAIVDDKERRIKDALL